MAHSLVTCRAPVPAERGVALIFALLALVVLSLGAVALIRSVDTSVLALGNLSFKQSGLASGSRRTDDAMDWLAANMGTVLLDDDQPTQGYYASSLDSLDATGRSVRTANVLALVDWDENDCKVDGSTPAFAACINPSPELEINGDKVRYVITRLCSAAGPVDSVNCAVPPIPAEIQSAGKSACGYKPCPNTAYDSYNPYYRVITRTVGPKGTVSFTETLAHF